MFNPDPESDVVKKLKDSLKIADGEDKVEDKLPPQDVRKSKRKHGVGFKIKSTVKKSVEQVKLLSKFRGDSKKAAKKVKRPDTKSKPLATEVTEDESRLDLIFKHLKRKNR